jgi:hypothetical protein
MFGHSFKERYGPWRGDFLKMNVILASDYGDLTDEYNRMNQGNFRQGGGFDWSLLPGGADPSLMWGPWGFSNTGAGGMTDPTYMGPGGGTTADLEVIGYTATGDPIFRSNVLDRLPREDEMLVPYGKTSDGRTIYMTQNQDLLIKPASTTPGEQGANVTYPGGQQPVGEGDTFSTTVGEPGGGGGMVVEPPPDITPEVDITRPGWMQQLDPTVPPYNPYGGGGGFGMNWSPPVSTHPQDIGGLQGGGGGGFGMNWTPNVTTAPVGFDSFLPGGSPIISTRPPGGGPTFTWPWPTIPPPKKITSPIQIQPPGFVETTPGDEDKEEPTEKKKPSLADLGWALMAAQPQMIHPGAFAPIVGGGRVQGVYPWPQLSPVGALSSFGGF